jgi:hypothetical protein
MVIPWLYWRCNQGIVGIGLVWQMFKWFDYTPHQLSEGITMPVLTLKNGIIGRVFQTLCKRGFDPKTLCQILSKNEFPLGLYNMRLALSLALALHKIHPPSQQLNLSDQFLSSRCVLISFS